MRKSGWGGVWLAVALAAGTAVRAEEAAAPVATDPWQVTITPYVWAPSISGEVGLGDARADVDLPISQLLEDLELAGMLNAEVRRNRLGLLVDGVYVKFTTGSDTPGPFFNTIDTTVEMAALDVALAYRVLARDRGWLDVLAGGRYMYVSAELEMAPDYEAVDAISASVMQTTAQAIQKNVGGDVKQDAGEMAEDLAGLKENVGEAAREMVRDRVQGKVDETVEDIIGRIDAIAPPGLGPDNGLGDGRGTVGDAIRAEIRDDVRDRLDDVGEAMRDAIADAVKERLDARMDEIQGDAEAIRDEIRKAAEASIDDLKRSASKEVRRALEEAERRLAGTIEEGMTAAADADLAEEREWVDPYVGARARLNLTERVYVGGRADIGGFGLGSELAWQVFGGVGMHVTPRVDLEAGWRHLDIDYDHDNLKLDLALSGVAAGVRVQL